MRKIVNIDFEELEKMDNIILNLRNQTQQYQQEITKLNSEINFLKDTGENILVIVKDNDKPDTFEYKTNEKNVLVDLVSENSRIRERYDELSRRIDNVENQKQLIILKYKEMETIYKNQIYKLDEYIHYLENRSLIGRLKNEIKKPKQNINFISFDAPELLEAGPTKTIYTEDEIKKLEDSVKDIKKSRGWQFKSEYVDSCGNVYHKGKLQPHLKK